MFYFSRNVADLHIGVSHLTNEVLKSWGFLILMLTTFQTMQTLLIYSLQINVYK